MGMTQIEFAEKMHVTRQTVSRWEAGSATILEADGDRLLVRIDSAKGIMEKLIKAGSVQRISIVNEV